MIADSVPGLLARGICIEGVSHEPLRVSIDGRPARLAILDESGQIVAEGADVQRECAAVIVGVLHNFWRCQGWQKVLNTAETLQVGRGALAAMQEAEGSASLTKNGGQS